MPASRSRGPGRCSQLVFSGGVDREDGRIEAEVMERHARSAGYAGPLLLEARLVVDAREPGDVARRAAGRRRQAAWSSCTEPYHLWRAERLARASGFDRAFDVQYAAAPHVLLAALGHGLQGRVARAAGDRQQCASNGYF